LARARRVALATVALSALSCGSAPRGEPLHIRSGSVPVEPLVVRGAGARYFTGARTGRTVYLTGAHTWNNFQDWDASDPPRAFDFERYLDFLEAHGHNLIRLYVWEQAAWFPGMDAKITISPLPYLRTGPGLALDGRPRFDVHQFDPAYFARLRERVDAAAERGIYVSVMLFDGWSVEAKNEKTGNPWRGHPFNRENNVNGVDGDLDRDGKGVEIHTLANPEVTALERAYLAKVVETLRDRENVLFEISNESAAESVEWQYEMIRTLRELEAGGPLQHPIGMTVPFPEGPRGNQPLFASPADWISPHLDPERTQDLESAVGRKIVLADTDHIFGVGGDGRWVWETFMRGANPLFMDPCVTEIRRNLPAWSADDANAALPPPCPPSEFEGVRLAMGYARALAARVDLARLEPRDSLCSTSYCLVDPGKDYLVFAPIAHHKLRRLLGAVSRGWAGESFDVDLSSAKGMLSVEWLNTETGELFPGDPVAGGGRVTLRAPFPADALLHARSPAPLN
jgi:uncharacterized protein DUF6298